MQINKMTNAHIEEVLNMMREFYSSPAVLTNASEEIFKFDIQNCINENPYLEGYVFEKNGIITGYAMIAKSFSTEFGKRCIWIEDIYFKPKYRKKGGGSKFLAFLEQKYPNEILRLEVEKENECAIKTYQKNGFKVLPYMEMKK